MARLPLPQHPYKETHFRYARTNQPR
jgi:hypothetical protein